MSSHALSLALVFSVAVLLEVVIVPVEERLFGRKSWRNMTVRERRGAAVFFLLGVATLVESVRYLLAD